MCMQDLWISQYLEGSQYEVAIPNAASTQILGANPRRWAVMFWSNQSVINVAFGQAPSAASIGLNTSNRNNTGMFVRRDLGNLISKPVFCFSSTTGIAMITEVSLTAPLEYILEQYNQWFRKEQGVQWQVPNPLLPQMISRS